MQINVGLVGYGLAGAVFHAPLIQAADGLKLTTVVSSRPEVVAADLPAAKVVPSFEALLHDPGIHLIVVASPNGTHCEYARQALLAGKHVVVDKPFTITAAEADELIGLARAQGLVLTVFQNRRWDGDFLTVRNLLTSELLGDLYTYEAHFDRYRPQVKNRWKEQPLPGSGVLYDLGAHLIDQALVLFGVPQSVGAVVRAQRPGGGADDYFHLTLDYGRLQVILHSGSVIRQSGPRLQLHGAKGSFLKHGLDPQEEQLKAGLRPGAPLWGQDRPEQHGELTTEVGGLTVTGTVATLPGRYEAFYSGVAQAILTGAPAPVDPADARNTIRVIELALRSHAQMRSLPFHA